MQQLSIWQQRKALLANRNFTLLLLHAFLTVGAGAVCYIVLTWHVMNFQHHHPMMSSILVSLSFWLPSVLLSPVAGVIVDRYPRKYVVMVTNFMRMLSFVLVGVLLQWHDTLWLCCLLNAINGCIFTVLGPAAMAFVRELVANEQLLAANSTIDICIELANILGMGFAGVLIVLCSTSQSLFIVAATVALGIIMLCFVQQRREEQYHQTSGSHPWQQFKDGLAYLRPRPVLILLYFLNMILFVQFMISPILLAPFIKTVLHGSGHDFSITELGLSGGVIVGSILIPWICERFGRIPCLFGAIVWLSIMFFLISITGSIDQVVVLYILLGVGLPLWSVIASYSQEFTEKSMQGRIQSIFNSLASVCLLFVYLVLALSSKHTTLAHCFWFCSGLGGVALLLLFVLQLRIREQRALSA